MWRATKEADAPPKSITIPNEQQLTQTVYADDNRGKSDVTFTTSGAWSSTIAESASERSSKATPDWISISPSSGDKAGSYTIQITLKTNYTGAKRSATVSLKCSGELANVTITQEALTAAGEQPKPEEPEEPKPSGSGVLTNETTGKSVKLVASKHDVEGPEVVLITFIGEEKKGENGEKDQPGFEYINRFFNPLENGKLKPGTYNITNEYNGNGGSIWFKSDIGTYGESGTIKVELNNDTYTFTFDFIDQDKSKFTGSFTGVPEYINKEVKVESITLSETEKTLAMREEFSLTATVLPENATDKRYSWSSSNPAVATVSEEGLVRSVSAGKTTITATSTEGAKTATCAVTVQDAVAVTGITVEPSEVTLLEGESIIFYM